DCHADHGRRDRRRAADPSRRGAQQGIAEHRRLGDAPGGGLRPALRRQAARADRPLQRRRLLLPAPPRHRAVRGGGHPRHRHHRPRPAHRLRRQGGGEPAARLRPLHLPVRCPPRADLRGGRPGRQAHRHVVRRSGAPLPPAARHRRDRHPSRRGGGDQRPAGGGRRDRGRRGDRQHPAPGRARGRRRGDHGVRGGAHQPHRRGRAPGAGRLPASVAGRPRRPLLRDDGLRHPVPPRRGGGRADSWHREPDGLPPAPRGVGRRALDGPEGVRAARDGRALRDRCPRHPDHRHPCLPAL
ncbi:MAG: ATP phosphoribosyltransferase _ HisGl, partial [uncultured Nocardioidaceae bacterium]